MESRDRLFKTGILTASYYQYLGTVVPNPFGTRDWFLERQFSHRPGQGDGFNMIQVQSGSCSYAAADLTGGGTQVVKWAIGGATANVDKVLLTSSCVAWLPVGRRLIPAHSPGAGLPCLRILLFSAMAFLAKLTSSEPSHAHNLAAMVPSTPHREKMGKSWLC